MNLNKKLINQLLDNNNACAFWPECSFGFMTRMKRFFSLFQLNDRGIRICFQDCRMQIHANSHKQLQINTRNSSIYATIHMLHNCAVIN